MFPAGSTCSAITSGESRAANSMPWREMLLQCSTGMTTMGGWSDAAAVA